VDLITVLSNSGVRDVSAIALLTGVVVLILTGGLVPGRTHKRELLREVQRADEWKAAHGVSEQARSKAMDQNSTLLASVRIADQFYRDFVPPVEHSTPGGHDVAV
jgi:hypothetical protein